jgi:PPM family protein phosphatase
MANAATLKPLKPQISTAAASPPTVAPACTFAMLSHRGRVRHSNQDACAALPEHGAYIICDGMGGAAGGEVASHLATEAFLNSLTHPAAHRAAPKADPNPDSAAPNCPAPETYPPNHPHSRLHQAVCAANHAVFLRAQKSRTLRGMGTTLVAMLWEDIPAGRNLWLAHVGDSRCYVLRRGALQLLTRDHSLVEEQVRAGLMNRAQAAFSPVRNIITRAIGSQPTVEPEIATHTAQPGDLYLLASDGLTRELDDTEIAHILTQSLTRTADLESACKALIDAANKTVLLVACP